MDSSPPPAARGAPAELRCALLADKAVADAVRACAAAAPLPQPELASILRAAVNRSTTSTG